MTRKRPFPRPFNVECTWCVCWVLSKLLTRLGKYKNVFNNFFSNIIKNLDIPQYKQADQICHSIKGSMIKVIIKYKNHPSATNERCTNSKFKFSFMKEMII